MMPMIKEKELARWENEGGYVSLGGEVSTTKKLVNTQERRMLKLKRHHKEPHMAIE